MRLGLIGGTLMWVLIVVVCSGCGSTRGWRVSFGVAPVSNIQDEQGLKEMAANGKY